jgi:hypothetical protein
MVELALLKELRAAVESGTSANGKPLDLHPHARWGKALPRRRDEFKLPTAAERQRMRENREGRRKPLTDDELRQRVQEAQKESEGTPTKPAWSYRNAGGEHRHPVMDREQRPGMVVRLATEGKYGHLVDLDARVHDALQREATTRNATWFRPRIVTITHGSATDANVPASLVLTLKANTAHLSKLEPAQRKAAEIQVFDVFADLVRTAHKFIS